METERADRSLRPLRKFYLKTVQLTNYLTDPHNILTEAGPKLAMTVLLQMVGVDTTAGAN